MERNEPALVPQWYKFANGSSSNNTLRISTSKRSDKNGMGCGSGNRLLSNHDKNFRRSLSSNGSAAQDRGKSAKSQAYSSFRRSHDKNQESDFDSYDRENRSLFVDNGLYYHDSFLRVRTEKDAFRRSQSMIAGRKLDSWPEPPVSCGNNTSPLGSVIGITDRKFEKDFPSLQAEVRQNFPDSVDALTLGPKTAVHSLPVATPIINGTSALAEVRAEVPVKVETDGNLLSSATGNTMAETLAQRPSLVGNASQSSVDTQRIEELTLKKCKQLIPVTPVLPKALNCNLSEKAKSKSARGGGGDFSSFAKGGHQINLVGRTPARSDIAKTHHVGNFQVLNREKNISPISEDSSSLGKANDHVRLVPSATVVSSKSQSYQKLKGNSKNGLLTRASVGEQKLLSYAQKRNDFFNLLRKKSLNPTGSIPEPDSLGPADDLQSASSDSIQNCQPGFDCSAENRNFSTDEPNRLYAEIEESHTYLDSILDPEEEEAFLRSLGWDKNAGEEGLSQEEIDAFLKKYETHTRRPLKISIS
ncbi:uncharacterized protein LOC121981383 [Zingiber officinale]|uniref:Uncharacterized protein n=1 Tax=Zingiber officinale TaxID=94328 RepID=A0A8J5LCA4_ZINOF|nr:uncharacterized protein LOC121981383 [Zingiber officinale]KAG6507847.1 hypothetical protein ZIOFF_033200 [Zingiber officinale]